MSQKQISVIATIALLSAILGLFYTSNLFGNGPVTIAIQVAAVLLMIWARLTFGLRSFHFSANPVQKGDLVTSGPYRFLRHPIYVSIWIFAWTGAIAHLSLLGSLFALAVFGALLTRMLCEEELLLQRFPEYVEYSKRAKRLIPFVY